MIEFSRKQGLFLPRDPLSDLDRRFIANEIERLGRNVARRRWVERFLMWFANVDDYEKTQLAVYQAWRTDDAWSRQ